MTRAETQHMYYASIHSCQNPAKSGATVQSHGQSIHSLTSDCQTRHKILHWMESYTFHFFLGFVYVDQTSNQDSAQDALFFWTDQMYYVTPVFGILPVSVLYEAQFRTAVCFEAKQSGAPHLKCATECLAWIASNILDGQDQLWWPLHIPTQPYQLPLSSFLSEKKD